MTKEQDRFLTIPNVITSIRIIAAPLIVYLAFVGSEYTLLLFAIISISDFFDGKIARRFNMVSDLGKSLDPLADKALVIPMLALFLYREEIGILVFLLIFSREIVVIACRWIARQSGYATPSLSIGKWKANFEFVAIGFLLATPNQIGISYLNDVVAFSGYQMHHIGAILLWCAALLAWISLIQLWYVYKYVFVDEKGHT
jgi:CDP-diacylglycerol--glycerol-3-phosphate 3-phosphatidyltransferase